MKVIEKIRAVIMAVCLSVIVTVPATVPVSAATKLTAYGGVYYGPSGKETYYDLNMSTIVAGLKAMGIKGEYWVREDGVKMYGDYVLCAADLKAHPRGSIIPTSLGDAIVADTGAFVYNGSGVKVDIATAW